MPSRKWYSAREEETVAKFSVLKERTTFSIIRDEREEKVPNDFSELRRNLKSEFCWSRELATELYAIA